jgi:outer membrane lipoprotein carrier protein
MAIETWAAALRSKALMSVRLGLIVLVSCGLNLVSEARAAPPSGAEHLYRFFRDVHSVNARFNQVVLDEALNTIQESSGTLWIERPNKFRWDYDTPFRQEIVADGKDIWVYDKELQQVTKRALRGGLGDTPALLLAGKGRLEEKFTIKPLDRQGSLTWAQLIPKTKDGGFEDIRIGFENGKLNTLEMVDGFGQTTRVTLRDSKENPKIDAAKFTFTPPKGVDVVGE